MVASIHAVAGIPFSVPEYYDENPIEVKEWHFPTGQYGGLSEPGMKSKDQLFLGSYMMYTSIPNDVPVQLKLLGHNVILIGSHYDEYVIDYFYIRWSEVGSDQKSK
eukprot:CAMPEP_0174316898 /NCGR_PEP_ID=MMETSP0810-20121108/7261_1 /TAXON_ID=73025 ORGANISM="Eutreptiella gymnastica-like, Strain CCMP1594" /NCGR_SAMPLE_ID=MMETSP0810 /ASSEMBLY_ACC=CAM_ASM_000659 /LENGTH=105 /DNA_ID=CAMNT_0015426773 /DNA_START=1256 /DNA_END=1572 /DNA_ORIENTATION=-